MGDGQSPEARVEEFLELDQELETKASFAATGVYERGTIAGAERVPAGDGPEDYPVPIQTEPALRIDVETEGGIVETYIEWAPHGDGQGHVDRLLAVLGHELANIFGDRVALDYRDGYHGIDPDETARLPRAETEATGI